MLKIDTPQTIPGAEGVTVYDDSDDSALFYAVPSQPRFRLDKDGDPVFKFLKYRFPVDRADGKKGGGFVFFDCEFVVEDQKLAAITAAKQDQINQRFANSGMTPPTAKLGQITYTKGTSQLLLSDESGALIEKVHNTGTPSLFGNNVSSFNLELTPEGATLFEQAMQGKGGVVQVVYDLYFDAKLPPVTGDGYFHAEKYYSFHQQVDIDWELWSDDSYRETISEQFHDSQATELVLDPGMVTDQKLIDTIRDSLQHALDTAVANKMIQEEIAPVSADDRKVPDGIEHVTRDVSTTKVADFSIHFRENMVVEWHMAPQGTLPNITTLTDKAGKPVAWADHYVEVDLDDKFFKQLNVVAMANADFANLPLFAISLDLWYGATHFGQEALSSPDDRPHFVTYTENDVYKYTYQYTVHYKGAQQTFVSPVTESDDRQLVVDVDDTGILTIDISAGDINWDQVTKAQVTVRYEDSSNGVDMIERQFMLSSSTPTARFQELIFKPRTKPYKYAVKYVMKGGKELSADFAEGRSPRLYVNDPFSAMKTVGVRPVGDLTNDIQTIFLDLKYHDEKNQYDQTASPALSKSNPFFDWTFPVIDPTAGTVTYSGTIEFTDGSTDTIPETTATSATILVGRAHDSEEFLTVRVSPDLIDFSTVKLVKVSLHVAVDGVDDRHDVLIHKTDTDATIAPWSVRLPSGAPHQYEWEATFFMSEGASRHVGPSTSSDENLLPELPAA